MTPHDRTARRAGRGGDLGDPVLRVPGAARRRSGRPATSAATPQSTLRRVAFIRTAQRVGLTLEEIGEALATLPDGRTPDQGRLGAAEPDLAAPPGRADPADRAAPGPPRRLHRLRLPEPAVVCADQPRRRPGRPRAGRGPARPGQAAVVTAVGTSLVTWRSGSWRAGPTRPSSPCPGRRRSRSGASRTSYRSPAACPGTSSGSCGWASGRTPSRRPSRTSRSASTACCATCSGSACPRSCRRASSPAGSTRPASRCRARCSPSTCASRCPTAACSRHGLSADNLPSLVDAMVVLLVRLHLTGFFWGDVSLSNVLFRRSAGGFAAYLVDAETGEFKPEPVRTAAAVRRDHRHRERLRRAARPAGQRDGRLRGRGARHRGAARGALPRPVGRAHRRGGVPRRRAVADRAADRAAQRPRLRRRRARHRHRLRRGQDRHPAQGRRARPPPA